MARKKKAHRSRRQRAAARRNIRKAQAAYRRKYGCKFGKSKSRNRCRKAYRTPRQIAAAKRNLKKARAARRRKAASRRARRGGKRRSKKRSKRRSAASIAREVARDQAYFDTRENVLGADVEGPVGPNTYV